MISYLGTKKKYQVVFETSRRLLLRSDACIVNCTGTVPLAVFIVTGTGCVLIKDRFFTRVCPPSFRESRWKTEEGLLWTQIDELTLQITIKLKHALFVALRSRRSNLELNTSAKIPQFYLGVKPISEILSSRGPVSANSLINQHINKTSMKEEKIIIINSIRPLISVRRKGKLKIIKWNWSLLEFSEGRSWAPLLPLKEYR